MADVTFGCFFCFGMLDYSFKKMLVFLIAESETLLQFLMCALFSKQINETNNLFICHRLEDSFNGNMIILKILFCNEHLKLKH